MAAACVLLAGSLPGLAHAGSCKGGVVCCSTESGYATNGNQEGHDNSLKEKLAQPAMIKLRKDIDEAWETFGEVRKSCSDDYAPVLTQAEQALKATQDDIAEALAANRAGSCIPLKERISRDEKSVAALDRDRVTVSELVRQNYPRTEDRESNDLGCAVALDADLNSVACDLTMAWNNVEGKLERLEAGVPYEIGLTSDCDKPDPAGAGGEGKSPRADHSDVTGLGD